MIGALLGDLVPYLVAAVVAVIGFLGYGKVKERKGKKEADARHKAEAAEATIKAHEVRNEVEADIARRGDARGRLRSDWRE